MAQQNFITNLYLHPALLQARRYACKTRRPDGPVRGGARKQPPRRLILSYFTPFSLNNQCWHKMRAANAGKGRAMPGAVGERKSILSIIY